MPNILALGLLVMADVWPCAQIEEIASSNDETRTSILDVLNDLPTLGSATRFAVSMNTPGRKEIGLNKLSP